MRLSTKILVGPSALSGIRRDGCPAPWHGSLRTGSGDLRRGHRAQLMVRDWPLPSGLKSGARRGYGPAAADLPATRALHLAGAAAERAAGCGRRDSRRGVPRPLARAAASPLPNYLGTSLLTDPPVAVTVPHGDVRRMVPPHRGNAVAPCLRTGNPPVAVIVPQMREDSLPLPATRPGLPSIREASPCGRPGLSRGPPAPSCRCSVHT